MVAWACPPNVNGGFEVYISSMAVGSPDSPLTDVTSIIA